MVWKSNETQVFALSMQEINKALDIKNRDLLKDVSKTLPTKIKHWSTFFLKNQSNNLPPHRQYDMKINLEGE